MDPSPLFVYTAWTPYAGLRRLTADGWHHAGTDGLSGMELLQTTDRQLASTQLDDEDLDVQEFRQLADFCERYSMPMPYALA